MRFCLTVALTLITSAALAQQTADAVQPEGSTAGDAVALSDAAIAAQAAKAAGTPVAAETYMVAAANPLAVQAGVDVLAEGGTAADAMVAVQAVLGLVEPQSSGLGGGAFLVWREALHTRWGNQPWAGLCDDAIDLADGGFAVSPRLAGLVTRDAERLSRFADTAAYFLPGGTPLQTGDTLTNAAYAQTLRAIADSVT